MKTPIELLKAELNQIRLRALHGKGMSKKKREAKALIPMYENAIQELEKTPDPEKVQELEGDNYINHLY